MKTATGIIVLLLVALGTCSLQDLITAMTPTATSPGCISFSPFVDNLNPNYGSIPSESLIQTLLNTLISQTSYRCIHIYDLSGPYSTIVQVAESLGLKVLANVYISSSTFAINNVSGAISTAVAYPNTLLGISCGSEIIYESNNPTGSRSAVASCISQFRAGGVTQPIGYIDVFTGWCGGSEYPCTNFYTDLESIVDFIGVDMFPWWSNTYSRMFPCEPASNAVNQTFFSYYALKRVASKPVLITEFGWPGSGGGDIISQANVYTGQQCGVANPTLQQQINQQTINECAANGIACSLFEAFNEAWKGNGNSGDVNNFWGICSGTSPYTCTNAPTGATSMPSTTSALTTTTAAPVGSTSAPDTTPAPTTTSEAPTGPTSATTSTSAITTTNFPGSGPNTTVTTIAPTPQGERSVAASIYSCGLMLLLVSAITMF
jgi:exo-beta-1,3-glucanase (GH17 family)